MRYASILDGIGNTAHVRINNLFGKRAEIWLKLERSNPGGSIKDRIALSMIEDAEEQGLIHKETVIVEPTSGNTGIGLAMVAAVKKYKLILVMPESMSIERRRLMSAYGAKFELTPREKGMKGAIERANELANELPNAWIPRQFENEANINAHRSRTAQEILNDFPDGLVSYQVIDVAPGSTVTVKVTFPSGIPAGSKLYKVGPAGFTEVVNPAIQDHTVTLTLTDGGQGDSDGLANGVIVDPVGVAVPATSGTGSVDLSSASGGGGCSVAVRTGSGGSDIDGTLILAGLGLTVWRIRTRRRRG